MWHNINMLIVILYGGNDKVVLGSENNFLTFNKQMLPHFVNKSIIFPM